MSRSPSRALCSIVLAALLCACAPYQKRSVPQTAGEEVINPSRGERGNPSSYEVFGQRYFVLSSSDGYRDSGVASWYGRDFQGNVTSSGERYDMYAYTAAHKTLPIPTWVEVTNRENGRAVIVKVNDRGPFVDDRLIDLSYAAALEIGMVRAGTARVFVRALGAPGNMPTQMDPDVAEELLRADTPPTVIAATAAEADDNADMVVQSATASSDSGMYIQVGAFSEVENALRMVQRLVENGFVDSFLDSDDDRSQLHRVRIGPLLDSNQFDFIRDGLSLIGIDDAHLVIAP